MRRWVRQSSVAGGTKPLTSACTASICSTAGIIGLPDSCWPILTVGPGKQYVTIRAAAAASQNGDTIHITAGDYRGDVATWNASNLTICGIGGRARLYADGVHEGGKGIWVIRGSSTTVHSVEFHGAKVPDQNGAGIRQEGPTLTLRDTGFYDNENGILTDDGTNSTITIEYSEFARNGFGDGQSHNIYIGQIGLLNVRNSFFHEARIGHNLKTRARENIIENSYFMDGINRTSSYLLNFDNGGRAVLRGNFLHKGPLADNSILITHYANFWGAGHADRQYFRRHQQPLSAWWCNGSTDQQRCHERDADSRSVQRCRAQLLARAGAVTTAESGDQYRAELHHRFAAPICGARYHRHYTSGRGVTGGTLTDDGSPHKIILAPAINKTAASACRIARLPRRCDPYVAPTRPPTITAATQYGSASGSDG